MARRYLSNNRSRLAKKRASAALLNLEPLEPRLLLYSELGDQFVYSSRITYSFMPDGTSVGGVPSALFSTMNARFATATWETQIEQAASVWENVANLNLSLVPDGGEPDATSGDQQDDPRFGDIRIGAVPLGAGTLAVTFLPPPANGGTDAGDILLNSSINWQVGSNYDLMTVMVHEFGHALGLGDVSNPLYASDVMFGTYNGIKTSLAADDVAGVQAVDGIRKFDMYNQNGNRNITYLMAANITSDIGAYAQIAIPSLDITTAGDSEWFYLTIPSGTSGTMKVTVQSTNLSSLSPKLQLYTSSLSLVGQAGTVNSMAATISVSTSVSANQGYYIKVLAAGGNGPIGSYGLLVNMGSQAQSPIPPPNTVVAQQPDEGSGSLTNAATIGGSGSGGVAPGAVYTTIGSLSQWAEVYSITTAPVGGFVGISQTASASISGLGLQPGLALATVTGPIVPATPAPRPSPVRYKPVNRVRAKREATNERVHVTDRIKVKHPSLA